MDINIATVMITFAATVGGGLISAITMLFRIKEMHSEVVGELRRTSESHNRLADAIDTLALSHQESTKRLIENAGDHSRIIDRLDAARHEIVNQLVIAKSELINEIAKA